MGVVRFLNVSGLLIILLFASGCASIVSKTSYPVTIRSQPPGADVEIKDGDGKLVRRLKTPSSVVLKAGDGFFKPAKYNFKFSKSGYNPTSSKIAASLDGWYVGNVVFGGLIGILIVDPATGAMYKLDDTVQATLVADEDSGVNLQSQPANEGGDGIELKFDPAEHPHLGSTAAV